MHQTKKMFFLFILFFMAILQGAGLAQIYYVNPSTGNDSSNGSSSQPWRTISKAKSTVVAGDIVNLMPGSYGSVTFSSGDRRGTSWNAPITYRNNPGSTAYSAKFTNITFNGAASYYTIIEGVDVLNTGSHDACIKTSSASQVRIIDCKAHGVSGGSGPGYANIFCSHSNNILIEDCEVYYGGAWSFAIQLEESDSITVRGCHVHDLPGSGIRTGGGQNYIIEDNIVHSQRPEWNSAVHGSGIAIHSHDTVIRGNIVYNFGNTRPIRFYQSYAGSNGYRNMLVENNLVFKTSDFNGTQWWVEFIDVGPNCVFRNNTFYEATIMVFAQNANGSGVTIRNNIFAKGFELSDYGASGSSPGRTSKWDNINEGNNFFSALTAKGCGYICGISKFSSSSNSIVGGSYAVGTMFASGASHYPFSSGYPYRLCQGSPAINFGNASYAPLTDLLGNSRTGAPDAGCYEYGGSAPQNQPPIANAGTDQTVSDTDGNGSQPVTLNGSASTDSDGSIASYVWTENGTQIATGVNPTVTLNTGAHTITLRVTDNGGLTATDTVVITVNTTVDTTPPSVVSVSASSTNLVTVEFSEPVTAASAQTISNYSINGLTVTQAALTADSKTVNLTTSAQQREMTYDITISNVKDIKGNTMTAQTISYTFSADIVGYWKFNENNGATTKDHSGKSNNGTLKNNPTWSGSGELDFYSSNSHVDCGTVGQLNPAESFTITASVNPRSFGQGGFARIVDKGTASSGFSMFLQQSNSSLAFVPYGGNIINSETNAVTLNQWQHVAFVCDRAANTATFYIDGQPRGTMAYTAAVINSF